MERAVELQCKSVAIPAISSGIFGYPKELCAEDMFSTVEQFVREYDAKHESISLRVVRFTNFDTPTTSIFKKEFKKRYVPKANKLEVGT